ncbi:MULTISPECIES: 3-oxoacyl-ACP synthase III family protein [unclassified Anabaena]|uniref:3-oxoacyl-ACP synthase III family protein n=1 Tax=unclassified Anabaena TaxID=2619674 RepID=UPI0014455D69|nr:MULTISPECIES: ketoacyl-ACP synthase III [unclassified Anabaena]MTJ07335.1 ketoacyl-ACP synthase III [Anabaena sp. UHCC 0204]MTJ55120.1 ketoacyl-ACP synthase III [Anabaena sp. UHCC 0253]
MNKTSIPNISMRGIAVALPQETEFNHELSDVLEHDEIERISQTIGIYSRRVAEEGITAFDLMYQAVNKLLNTTNIRKENIDCLVCITQTPDYLIPGNSFLLCHQLGLDPKVLTLDINTGCAGFTHGLIVLGKLLNNGDLKCGLLVIGDTITKLVNNQDKAAHLLFGDGAAACVLEFDQNSQGLTAFWRTIADDYDKLIVPAGGMRKPISQETSITTFRGNGIYRSDNDLAMDGAAVFSFCIKEVPDLVNFALRTCNLSSEDIDLFVFHQANKFMVDYIRKKLKLSAEKVPILVEGIGNTSGASIPIAISRYAYNQGINKISGRLCLTGFGVGLSLSSIIIEVEDLIVTSL